MSLPKFPVTGNLHDILSTLTGGEIDTPAWANAYVILASNITEGVLVWNGGIYDRPPSGVKATVDPITGDLEINDGPVKLVDNDPGLNVTGIQYRCDIKTSPSNTIASFWFDAPGDGSTVNLATVAHVPPLTPHPVSAMSINDLLALLNDGGSSARAILNALYAGVGALTGKEDVANKSTSAALGSSDTLYPSQKAVKAYVDAAATGVLKDKGVTDCSANPNYPAAVKGDAYQVSVAGKIGGASGKPVDVGDMYRATADNAGGTEASVGTSWAVLEHNLVGALLAGNNLADIANPATARTNLGLDHTIAVVTYSGSLTTTRPTADAVYWVGYPSTPTNAQPQDIIAGSAGVAFITSAGGTTPLTATSAPLQVVVGSAFQQVSLPTTGVVAGQAFQVDCETSGGVDVLASGGGTVVSLQQSETGFLVALVNTPTTAAHWAYRLLNVFHAALGSAAFTVAVRDANGAIASKTPINPQTGTTYTLAATDDNAVITMNNGSAQTLTFPQNSAVAIPVGASGEIHVIGAGQVTNAAGTGATVNSRGTAMKSAGQFAVYGWRKIATNTFTITGDLIV